jgi:putative transposase
LHSVFAGAVGKDVVSRTLRKVKSDWEAWNARSLKDDKIVRLELLPIGWTVFGVS